MPRTKTVFYFLYFPGVKSTSRHRCLALEAIKHTLIKLSYFGVEIELFYRYIKADFQSVLRTLQSLFMTFVLFHVRRHKM